MWQSRILFASADLYSDPSSVLGVLAVSRSLSVAVPSKDTLAPVSPWCCGEVAGVKPELRTWLRALTCPLRLAFRSPSVPHLAAVSQVLVQGLPGKTQRGGGRACKAMDSALEG